MGTTPSPARGSLLWRFLKMVSHARFVRFCGSSRIASVGRDPTPVGSRVGSAARIRDRLPHVVDGPKLQIGDERKLGLKVTESGPR